MKHEPGVYPRLNLEKQKEWTTEKKKIPKVYVCFVIAVCYIHFLNNPPSKKIVGPRLIIEWCGR